MKTLSIQQPWASLICAGIKDVENRSWKASKVPGRILIHASSKKVTKNFYDGIPEEMESYISNNVFYGNIAPLNELPTSAIIGYVTVTGFEDGEVDSVWADGPGVIKWKLEDAWLFDNPMLNVKGKLNLFDYDLDENNLPPAHQVELRQITVEGDEVIIPTTDLWIKTYEEEEFEGSNVYVTDDNIDILGETKKKGLYLKPFRTIKFEGQNKFTRFELKKESCILPLPDIDDETKPYVIQYHDGTEGQWLLAQFVFGDFLESDEFVAFCGGKTILDPEIERIIKNKK